MMKKSVILGLIFVLLAISIFAQPPPPPPTPGGFEEGSAANNDGDPDAGEAGNEEELTVLEDLQELPVSERLTILEEKVASLEAAKKKGPLSSSLVIALLIFNVALLVAVVYFLLTNRKRKATP